MSNVTAVLQCPGCDTILEAEERPNIDWKLGTTRIVLVPEQNAIEHFFECLDFARPDLDVPGPVNLEAGPIQIEGTAAFGVDTIGPLSVDEVTEPAAETDEAPATEETAAPAEDPAENVEETAPADTKPAPKRRTSK